MKKYILFFIFIFLTFISLYHLRPLAKSSVKAYGLSSEQSNKDCNRILYSVSAEKLSSESLPFHNQMQPEEDRKRLEFLHTEVLNSLPRIEDLDEDGHHTPQILLLAGQKIGLIEEDLEQHPTHLQEAIRFYEQCLLGAQVAIQVRTLCYLHLEEHAPGHPSLKSPAVSPWIVAAAQYFIEG